MSDPWYLRVIRMSDFQLLHPNLKSWRPHVVLSILDDHDDDGGDDGSSSKDSVLHNVVLGTDGQNPNQKFFVPLHDAVPSTRLSIRILHTSQTKKKNRKPMLICSALVRLQDVLDRRSKSLPQHEVDYDIPLPTRRQQRRELYNAKKLLNPRLTLRFTPPADVCPFDESVPAPESESDEDGSPLSDVSFFPESASDTIIPQGRSNSIRERPHSPLLKRRHTPGVLGSIVEQCLPTNRAAPDISRHCSADPQALVRLAESFVDKFSPYNELREAEAPLNYQKAEKVLKRLLTEWQVIGALLLALVAIDTAVFGFAHDTLLAVNAFSRTSVVVGAIMAGIGLTLDAWFLLMFNGASVEKFLTSTKDVNDTYFFFCLVCRLPTMCMFVSAVALMLFLLATTWTVSPVVVLSICGFFGVVVGSQLLTWVIRTSWRLAMSMREQERALTVPPARPSTPSRQPAPIGREDLELTRPRSHSV